MKLSLVAVVFTLLVATVAAYHDDVSVHTAPLAEILAGKWRFEFVAADLSAHSQSLLDPGRRVQADSGDDDSWTDVFQDAWRVVSGSSARALKAAVQLLSPDEPIFRLEVAPALHDGVLVGRAQILPAGWIFVRDLLLSGSAAMAAPANIVEGAETCSAVVECFTMSRCTLTLRPDAASASSSPDDAVQPAIATVQLHLAYRASTAGGARAGVIRVEAGPLGFATVLPTESNETARGTAVTIPAMTASVSVMVGRHAFINLAIPDATRPTATRAVRIMGRRESLTLEDEVESGGWFASASWTHVFVYSILLLVVVGGKFGTKWYFKRQGIDVDPWLASLRSSKGRKQQRKRLPSDAAIRAQMDKDDDIEMLRPRN